MIDRVEILEVKDTMFSLYSVPHLISALADNSCYMRSAIWRLPSQVGGVLDEVAERGGVGDLPALELVCQLDTEPHGKDVKVTCFHPTDGAKGASVVDNKFVIWDLNYGDIAKVTVLCVDMQTGNESRRISLNLKFAFELYPKRVTNFSLILIAQLEGLVPVAPKNGIGSGPEPLLECLGIGERTIIKWILMK